MSLSYWGVVLSLFLDICQKSPLAMGRKTKTGAGVVLGPLLARSASSSEWRLGALRSSFSSWFFPTHYPMKIYFLYSCFSLGLLFYYEVRRLILKTKGKIRPYTYSIFHVPLFTLKMKRKHMKNDHLTR